MLDDVYNRRILALAAEIPWIGRLSAPHGTASAHSRLCGSTVTVDVILDGDRVAAFGHVVKACVLGQASSSVMARNVVGSSVEDLRALRTAMYSMLKDGGAAPGGRWSELAVLEPVREYRARHASTLLTFDAVVEAVEAGLRRTGPDRA